MQGLFKGFLEIVFSQGIGGGYPQPAVTKRPEIDDLGFVIHMLVDQGIGKPAYLEAGAQEGYPGFIRLFGPGEWRKFLLDLVRMDHFFTPTLIFSNLAGLVAWPTCIDWEGSPFPQLGMPHRYWES